MLLPLNQPGAPALWVYLMNSFHPILHWIHTFCFKILPSFLCILHSTILDSGRPKKRRRSYFWRSLQGEGNHIFSSLDSQILRLDLFSITWASFNSAVMERGECLSFIFFFWEPMALLSLESNKGFYLVKLTILWTVSEVYIQRN